MTLTLVLAEVAELAAPKLNLKTKTKQIIHLLNNERQAAILANTLLSAVKFCHMDLITKEGILKRLPSHYKMQYPTNRQFFDGSWSDEKIKLLEAENPLTEEKANEILGNKSWTNNKCDECKQDVFAVVQLGDEPDYDSHTASICIDCLNKAVALAGC